ncbi:threonine/serine exporter [Salibacterium salarium]|uniref:Threonine/serine exporter n=1 Tax=Salibacterium salarium TaxID=284579 RepID=A0A428MS76_9BACI|nr:threonine/serine exporter family protein [Salibacterium salarium]RSL28959.1 threonine/serine exporter [Salibacterium salarium]
MWLELIFCFVATVAFGIIFNIPLRLVWWGGLIGVVIWLIYSSLPIYGFSQVYAAAIAAFVAAFTSHWLARYKKVPVTTFTIPGIIPLVPGGKAYSSMLALVEENYIDGIEQGMATLLQAGSIAGGLVFALSIFSIGKGVGQRYETDR